MEITTSLSVANRKAWRDWLSKHYLTETEVWVIYPHKTTGKERITYNDAVEEALCFGWIDSTVKRLDADHSAQRFSPRNPKSPYSQTNKERLRWLIEHDQVMPEVHATLGDLLTEPFEIPAVIKQALQANEQAWHNFQKFSGPYQRIRVAYVDGARKRPAEFQKRLNNFIRRMEQNKQFGYGIEKYY
ncbi:MAG: YdeI/OmpD-associated family protein [Anaerolineaceae bacterium]